MKSYTIELTDDITSSLYGIAHGNSISVAEAMRRAFALLKVGDEAKSRGQRLAVFEHCGDNKMKLKCEIVVF